MDNDNKGMTACVKTYSAGAYAVELNLFGKIVRVAYTTNHDRAKEEVEGWNTHFNNVNLAGAEVLALFCKMLSECGVSEALIDNAVTKTRNHVR